MSVEQNWHQLSTDKALAILQSSPQGLDNDEVLLRKDRYGPNKLRTSRKINPWLIFLEQFKDFLIIILIVAVIISMLIGETLDASVILGIVFLCALLGFFQEYRSEKAVEALKKMASPTARVIRNGIEYTIDAEELVPGDIVCFQTGDLIPADARALETFNLNLDESIITGESTPVLKHTKTLPTGDIPLGDRLNMLFASTVVTRGRGKGVVTDTGMDTEFGKIAALLQEVKPEKTPLEEQMNSIGKWLGIGCLGVCAMASVLGILRGYPAFEMFIWGVSLAVAAVPEALPAVVTSALAIGVQKMAKQQAIVKRLAAVETLGCTTVICSDKTGTLTKNEMTVQEIWIDGEFIKISGTGYKPVGKFLKDEEPIVPDSYPLLRRLLELSILCNDAELQKVDEEWTIHGDPTEGALIVAGVKGGIDYIGLKSERPRVGEIPFEEDRKMMSTIHDLNDNMRLVSTKGAPEIILRKCTHIETKDGVREITENAKAQILSANELMAKKALRVLALSWQQILESDMKFETRNIEKGLIFCGLVGMIDPARQEAPDALRECFRAGIRPVMVTGDHLLTAQAIATAVGIIEREMDDKDREGVVFNGEDLRRMTDHDIDGIISNIRVFARVSPEHKLRIVEAYQRQGEVVAMTGDGVNDAPALKKADIGVAMGIKGTDVSREAADMILADDNFATIVNAVREGRAAFENIKKYLIFLLSCNIGEILILASAFFLGLPLPLIALQILWVNLTTDGLPALALGIDPSAPDIMGHPPRGRDNSVFTPWLVGLILIIASFICLVLFFIFKGYMNSAGLIKAQTMVFLTMILLEMFNVFNCRSSKYSVIKMGPWQNLWLIGAVAISVLLGIMVIHLPFLNILFHTRPIFFMDWLIAVLSSSSIVLVVELAKWIRRYYLSSK